ncbi:UDP-glucuronate 4-epimerase 3 [Dionaea muscipula]
MSHPHAGADHPSANGRFKSPYIHRLQWQRSSSSRYTPCFFLILFLIYFFYAISPPSSRPSSSSSSDSHLFDNRRNLHSTAWGGPDWERLVRLSSRIRSRSSSSNAPLNKQKNRSNGKKSNLCVLVTGAAGFVGSHVSVALRKRGDGVLGLDNFNSYYDVSLKRARQEQLVRAGIFIVEGDINDAALLRKLFDMVAFTHVMHLAAQAGVRYAIKNPDSYIHSNIAGLVNVLEVCKAANPQPAIVWASSSSVYGLNSKVPFSERDRTDQPASLYAATKKAGEAITHTYNNIHGLSITGLRFFTVYGPWGRPDMAYFSFTKDILRGKQISIYEAPHDHGTVARDFTYIDDIVKGCLGALDTAEKSTGSGGGGGGGGKKGTAAAQYRIFNLGNTSPVGVSELVNVLESLLKVKANKKILSMPRNGDVLFTHANISFAKQELGYEPTTDLPTGLKKFVKWYLSYYSDSQKRRGVSW